MTIKNILLVFIVALIVRVAYVWFFVEPYGLMLEDQVMYSQLGKVMAKTGYFLLETDAGLIPVTERLPGYPIFLSTIYNVFGENNVAVLVVQAIIDSLTCVVIGLIAELIVPRGFLVAGMISACNLGMVILSGMILTDTLFLFLFSLFILLAFYYVKNLGIFNLFMAFFVLSLSVLIRPVSYYLIFLLLLLLIGFFVWKRMSLKQIVGSLLLVTIPIAMVLTPVHYRNYTEYSSLALTSQGGGHVLGWVVPATYQYSGQGTYQEGQKLSKYAFDKAMYKDSYQISDKNPFDKSNYKMRVAKDILMELGVINMLHAWTAATVINLSTPSIAYMPVVRSMDHPSFYSTIGDGAINKLFNYVKNTDNLLYLLLITIGTVTSLVFLYLSLFGFYIILKTTCTNKNNLEILLFSVVIIAYFIIITGPIVGVKYRLPIEPLMTLFSTYAIIDFLKNRVDRN